MFLEINTHHCDLDFSIFDENNNPIIPKLLYVQISNKKHEPLP